MTGIFRFLLHSFLRPESRHLLYTKYRDIHDSFIRCWYTGLPQAGWYKLEKTLERFTLPVTEPVALITQAGRSGGSLLSQLFDGHPQCHVHPYEFRLGGPKSFDWPRLDLNGSPKDWFHALYETVSIRLMTQGYRKGRSGEHFPLYLMPNLQRRIFFKRIKGRKISDQREVYDAYMTSYFNAWLNNRNLTPGKKWIVGFLPWMLIKESNIENFFDIYPSGKIISLLRDPVSWYASSSRHSEEFEDMNYAMDRWRASTLAMVRNYRNYTGKIILLKFESLLKNPEAVMKYLCGELGIGFHVSMSQPTFNSIPIMANTSFKVEEHGIIKDALSRVSEVSEQDREIISNTVGQLYDEAGSLCADVKTE